MASVATTPTVKSLADLRAVLHAADGWPSLVAALRRGDSGTVDGAWGSSAALAAATLAADAPATVLVVLAHTGDAEFWAYDVAGFSGQRPEGFPAHEVWPPERRAFDDTAGKRLRLLRQLALKPPEVVLTTITALMQPVPAPTELAARGRPVRVGGTVDLDELGRWLTGAGYRRVDAVERPGEYSRRGGIFDIYSPDADAPYRLEFFGDEVESIRAFSAQTQRSLGDLSDVLLLGLHASIEEDPRAAAPAGRKAKDHFATDTTADKPPTGHLVDYLPSDAWVALVEPSDLDEQGRAFLETVSLTSGLYGVKACLAQLLKFPSVTVSALPRPGIEAAAHLRVESVERFSGNVLRVRDELDLVARHDRVLIACHNEAERTRLGDVLSAGQLASGERLRLVTGSVRAGFRLVDSGLVVLGSHELFHREQAPAGEKPLPGTGVPKRRLESRALDSFLELNDGDYVVHVVHGIARYRGMVMLDRAGAAMAEDELGEQTPREENLALEFRGGVRLYVPVSKIDLVQKYVGGGKMAPELSKLGGTSWTRKKERVEEAVRDVAVDMIQVQALRAAQPGYAFPNDSEWQQQFEESFPYQETPDQLSANAEIKGDLEKPRPMDRLLCGDVGYGKTEMAIRAAFKCVDGGKQVAVLVPTTILAEQHYRTFTTRFAQFPFRVEVLSRFRTGGEQKRVIKAIGDGEVDVVIGTHRLVSRDVAFKDLGLVVIDEEQRFGVEHKERLKQIRSMVDVLTMTATPIPRTLHLALLGIRDISNLETPPPERLPVETRIIRWDPALIRHAILREMNRGGQIYFVHNRVHDIHNVAAELGEVVPEARIVVGHGQMHEGELETSMMAFLKKEADILLATTIIESGVDIPNANTIFIDEADHYGLADLHQLRGRVGRQKNRAYAYMILHREGLISPQAAKRLKAIEEFTELGSGFKIAMRDLEIRGAGNILGTQQSGHIATVGYELYCQLLENAVREQKHLPLRTSLEVNVDLPLPAYLPRDYVVGQKPRMEVYRRLTRLRDPAKVDDFRQELRDRYGPLPEPAEGLLRLAELRMSAGLWQVASLHRNDRDIVLTYRGEKRMRQLVERAGGRLKVIDSTTAYYRLHEGEGEPGRLYEAMRHLLRPYRAAA